MADRLQYQAPSVFTDKVSEVNYDDGTVGLMDQMSGAFLDVAQKAHRGQLESDVLQAQKDGALAGTTEGANFKPSRKKSMVHKAYNTSGIQSATVQMNIASQQAIQRITLSNPGNPFAQQQQFEKWSDKFAGELPDGMIQPFRESFSQLAHSQITKSNAQLSDIRQSEAVAQFNTLESTFTNTLENYAPSMFEAGAVGNDAAKAVETLRKNYVEFLAQNGPSAEYNVGGYTIPAGEGRSNAFSVEEIGKKMDEFDKQILSSAVKGDFLKELEQGRGVGAYFNFVKGNTALTTVGKDGSISQRRVQDMLDNNEKGSLSSFMRTHISALNSMEAAEDRKADKIRVDYNKNIINKGLEIGFTETRFDDGRVLIHGNPDMLRMLYLQTVNDETGLVDFDTVEQIQSLMDVVGTGDLADPAVVSKTNLDIIDGSITSITQLPKFGLGDKARAEMIQMTRKINSGQHWSNSQRYTSMLDLGKASLAPAAATGFSLFADPNKESASDFAEFKERLMNDILSAEQLGTLPGDINALPNNDEFDIQTRARDIISEIKERRKSKDQDPAVKGLNDQIKTLNDVLNNPETSGSEAKKARDQLKQAIDEKARLKSANQFQSLRGR